jgi:CRISPR/Cas system-associated exonuclease Cas4 (RecB family)
MSIKSWSYSRLIDGEACMYRLKLKHIDRIPEEKAEAAERGTAIHLQAEEYVNSKTKKLPSTLSKFADEFAALRTHYVEKRVSLEGEWGFDLNWLPTDYRSAWLRIKGDAVVFPSKAEAVVIDYKTGRKDGNEIKHGEQVQLYAIATFIRNPDLKKIDVELWYLDKDEITAKSYTRNEALRYVQAFDRRAHKVVDATTFPANPTVQTCKWCAYGPNKGKQCAFGVNAGDSPLKAYREKFG